MKGFPYTEREEQILFNRLNKNLGTTGQVQWKNITTMKGRDKKSMANHWQHMKRLYTFDGNKWVLKQPNLFDEVTPKHKRDNAKKTPQNKRQRIIEKRVVVKKSFLWGAFKFERYE